MTLQIGIVGAGRAGYRRAQQLQTYEDVIVAGIADPNRPVRDAFVEKFGVKLAVSDHRRLAIDDNIDAVYICSPPATHARVALDTLEMGKHVIVEQPMALSVGEAEEMMAAAASTDLFLAVALPQRYDPVIQETARLIDANEIGYPYLVLLNYLENDFDRLNDWHDWMGTWETGGGGILMYRGSEMLDLLQYLLGEVSAVSAVCTRFAIEPLNKAEDSCLLGVEFMEDVLAEVALTGAARYSVWPAEYRESAVRLEIYGLDGSIRVTDCEPRLTVVSQRGRREISTDEIETDLPTDMHRDFLDAILEGREPMGTSEDARDALRVILASYKSSQMKRRVETLELLH